MDLEDLDFAALEDLRSAIRRATSLEIGQALVDLTFSGEDPSLVLKWCAELSTHPHPDVRGIVATCIGHLARLHGTLDFSRACPILELIKADSSLLGVVEDAENDIKRYAKRV